MENVAYVGDGVYVKLGPDGTIILYTSDGLSNTNTIYLEPQVYESLLLIVDGMRGIRKGGKKV
jgi:hypothetical protein